MALREQEEKAARTDHLIPAIPQWYGSAVFPWHLLGTGFDTCQNKGKREVDPD